MAVDQSQRRGGKGNATVPATQETLSPAAAATVVALNRKWAKCRSNNACVGGVAVPCRRLAIYPGLSSDRP